MGTVTFNTDVDKTVDIFKNVLLNVDKTVDSDVDLDGSLATAEASADALGGSGGGGGGTDSLFFVVDDGTDVQTTVAIGPAGSATGSNTGIAPGPNFPPPTFDFNTPDGEFFVGTSIPTNGGGFGSAAPTAQRTFDIDILSGDLSAELTSGLAGGGTRVTFSNGDETTSNQRIIYNADLDDDGDFGDGLGDAFSVIAEGCDPTELDEDDLLVFSNAIIDPGVAGSTVRLEIEFEDADGDTEAGAIFITDDFVQGSDLVFALGTFNGTIPVPPAGTQVAPGVFIASGDQGNPALDLDEIVRIELRILDDPSVANTATTFGSFEDPGLVAGENPGTGATDVSIDDFFITTECEDEEFGVLAEVDTFAQVSDQGAFAFAESLAALDPDTNGDTMIF